MNINFNFLFKLFSPYLIIIVLSYFVNTIIFYMLPKSTIEHTVKSKQDFKYGSYNPYSKESKKNTVVKKKITVSKEYGLLSNLTLNAIYAKKDSSGWAIVKDKVSSETHIIKQNGIFKGYKLTFLFSDYIIFTKNNKEYKLSLYKNKSSLSSIISNKTDKVLNKNIVITDNLVAIKRNYLNSYANNMKKIWKEIRIDEVRKNGIITGFKVTRLTKNSVISTLGIKLGDIIKKVNGEELNNYNKVFAMYKDLKNIRYINIEVLRNNEVMELNYEID